MVLSSNACSGHNWAGVKLGAGRFLQVSQVGVGVQGLEPSSAPFSGALSGSCIENEAAGTQTSAYTGCQGCSHFTSWAMVQVMLHRLFRKKYRNSGIIKNIICETYFFSFWTHGTAFSCFPPLLFFPSINMEDSPSIQGPFVFFLKKVPAILMAMETFHRALTT